MKVKLNHFVPWFVLAITVVLAGYATCLHLMGSPALFPSPTMVKIAVVIAMATCVWLIFNEYAASKRSIRNKVLGLPSNTSPAPAPKTTHPPYLSYAGFVGMFAILLCIQHAFRADDSTLWPDRYWPVLLPILLAFAAGYWLYDTLSGRLINGTRRGRSLRELRLGLVRKRIAIMLTSFAILAITLSTVDNTLFQMAYRNPVAGLFIVGIFSFINSWIMISR